MGEPFPSTQWSVVIACCRQQTPEWRDRMGEFCNTYWEPIYEYIRQGWGKSPDEARDLAQEFFTGLIEKPFGHGLRPENGRFRAYLRQAVKHFLLNARRDGSRQKRGGGSASVPLDADVVDPAGEPPDEVYDRVWLMALLNQALEGLEKEYRGEGRAVYFDLFSAHDLATSGDRPSYDDLAQLHALTQTQVRNMLYSARKRLGTIFRRQLRELVTAPGELEQELAELLGS